MVWVPCFLEKDLPKGNIFSSLPLISGLDLWFGRVWGVVSYSPSTKTRGQIPLIQTTAT